MKTLKITKADAGKTLIQVLRKKFPIGYVHKLFRKSALRVSGKRAKEETEVKDGDEVQLMLDFSSDGEGGSEIQKKMFSILYEDDLLAIVGKSPHIAVHEAPNIPRKETLIAQLEAHYAPGNITPLLVHRLDVNTSGCLIVAKNPDVAEELEAMFLDEKRSVKKEYIALVRGIVKQKEGEINSPLKGRDGSKVNALTSYEVMHVFKQHGVSLLLIEIKTGRLHQIRQHLAKINHPVVMDDQHGDQEFNRRFHKKTRLKRQFLHAVAVTFTFHGKKYHAKAELFHDLKRTLEILVNTH